MNQKVTQQWFQKGVLNSYKKGEIVTIGDPKKVVTEELIRDVYDVDARVGLDVDGEIYVLPKKFLRKQGD